MLRSRTPLTTLKIAVFAPMPSDSVSTAMGVNAGLFRSIRAPKIRFCQSVPTRHLRGHRPQLRGMFVAAHKETQTIDRVRLRGARVTNAGPEDQLWGGLSLNRTA